MTAKKQHIKLLTNINKIYELNFELIANKQNAYLNGIIGEEVVWIYYFNGEIVVETNGFMKGEKSKRNNVKETIKKDESMQQKNNIVLKLELMKLKNKERKWNLENIYSERIIGEKLLNGKVADFYNKLGKFNLIERTVHDINSITKEVRQLFKDTNYYELEKFLPLIQGLTYHKNYKIRQPILKTHSTEIIGYNYFPVEEIVIMNASGKIIVLREEEGNKKAFVYENKREYEEKLKVEKIVCV